MLVSLFPREARCLGGELAIQRATFEDVNINVDER